MISEYEHAVGIDGFGMVVVEHDEGMTVIVSQWRRST
jgi:hypothetical protein